MCAWQYRKLQEEDPLRVFLYALRAPETRRQYPRRPQAFLDFLDLEGSLEVQAREFLSRAKTNPQWAQAALMRESINPTGDRIEYRTFPNDVIELLGEDDFSHPGGDLIFKDTFESEKLLNN
jgi:hypothetical protein